MPLQVDFRTPRFAVSVQELEPQLRLIKVDTGAEEALGVRFDIRSTPTLVRFRDGRELLWQTSALAARNIVAWACTPG